MDNQIVGIIFSAIFSAGASWAAMNHRIKAVEKQLQKHDEHGDRLTRLETKLDILLEHLIKD